MKTLATSVGLVALGTTVLHAVETGALNAQQSTKPWAVSASLRGFYDDNIGTTSANETESFGLNITPAVDYGIVGEQTSFNLGYAFSANFYENPIPAWDDDWSMSHVFDGVFTHAFNPRVDILLKDSFAIGQEPDVLQTGAMGISRRVEGDNIRNYATAEANLQATRLLGFQVGYVNSLYNYDDEGNFSNSALLDRMEHAFHVDSRWNFVPQTVGIFGYRFVQTGFTGDALISPASTAVSDSRNSRSHIVYVGAEHSFTPDLFAQLNVGGQYTDYYNANQSETTPYAQGSLTYAYRNNGSIEAGITYQRSPTDAVGTGTATVLDAESFVFYGAWNHELLPHLIASANGSVQNQTFFGGNLDGETELYVRLGFNLAYEFTKHLSGNVGYNFDDTSSDIVGREYTRNRFYAGVTVAY